jgi:hypothetical protein
MIIKNVEPVGLDEGGPGVFEADFTLSNNIITITSDIGLDSRKNTKSNLHEYIGQAISLQIELMKNREKKICLLNSKTKKIEPHKFIEGRIIGKLIRIAKPPNSTEIEVYDIFIDCGVIVQVPSVSDEFQVGDFIHVDGYLKFDNVHFLGFMEV